VRGLWKRGIRISLTISKEKNMEKKAKKNSSKKIYPMPKNWYGNKSSAKIRRKISSKGGIDGKKLG
jgi:hypothetical protein